ncbi:hypothetical protein HYY69_04325 [Candidatus Woesearchaeota archaeon]|nr:hypothetical protein [Candidatus Woesearchaeota archaeon]
MEISLVTTNNHKVIEAQLALKEYGIKVTQINDEKIEHKDETVENTARGNAELFANKYKKAVIVEDTGIFFEAYPHFPGNNAKLMFNLLGYKGLLKVLAGEDRKAYFKTAIGYCEPGKKPKLFVEEMHGAIADDVQDQNKDVLPYERIFITNNNIRLSTLSKKQKDQISHRGKAFRALGAFLHEHNKT